MLFLHTLLVRDIHENLTLTIASAKGEIYFLKKLEPEYNVSELFSEVDNALSSNPIRQKILEKENLFISVVRTEDFKRTFVEFLLNPNPLWHFFGETDVHYSYEFASIFLM